MVNARRGAAATPREEQVVALVAAGLSNREVAQELCLSEHTIKKYIFRIFDKLGISSRVGILCTRSATAACARRNGLRAPALENSRRPRLS